MQIFSKPKEFRSALKGSKVFPRGKRRETQQKELMQHMQSPNHGKGIQKKTSKTPTRP
jgi:hypothetical protein